MSIDTPNFAPPRALESPKSDFSRVLYGRAGEGGNGLDGELIVEFYIKPYPMDYLTESMGFPIFQDRIWVRIVAPGNSRTVWDTLAAGIEYDTAIDPDSNEYHTTWNVLGQCPNGDPPESVAPDTQMCCMLIREPVTTPKGFRTLEVGNKTVQFYAIVPIYEDEMRYKIEKGYSALVELLDQHHVTELVDLRRPSVVPSA